MSDFYQNGIITNFHNLAQRSSDDIERQMVGFARRRKMGLILPSLFSELEGPALDNIIGQLTQVNWLEEIVIGLDRADRDQFMFAREFFSRLPQRHRILWNDGPRLKALDDELAREGLAPAQAGKGRNVWYCSGYTLASDRTECVALHDCDIVTYDRSMLARLLYPLANPAFQYEFSKGFYARVANNKLNGRVSRLLVGPLLRSLQKVYGHSEYLDYLSSFRYPLSGEFAMRTQVLNGIKIPGDWGLEIGVLSEIYRNHTTRQCCQVEIADNYDHKHQPLAEEDGSGGLRRMSNDIVQSLLRKLATMGVPLTSDSFRVLKATYYRNALDVMEIYNHQAAMSGLSFDQHAEEAAVEMFTQSILEAGESFMKRPNDKPFIPSWNRVRSAFPDILPRLWQAVEDDNQGKV
ncbi:glycosyl transferase [Erwinia sp. OLTSP20]|uniref:glycosyl transferase n=1 Tax=unclassified Erwinia TaxID=2622719 RepID=UPI000C191F8C|nr:MULTISPECIES: glycosyl transferase [unclassified Erwinia]PIJ48521.1 glycosyl transferase [Erwinia sp. OAMSP11]PIJ69159.1 glycosyl transferase [Erwinia sp. OLSSP12]PIJ78786.1 glycosyl transferase [Erwinia sp. OLCASP19]PIJ81838.1 glycosyl transferase [Erwinia sp. OLMTSP26]PIJ82116.1 glycosyl transferase [Erwinia sp. OLMDSP33]